MNISPAVGDHKGGPTESSRPIKILGEIVADVAPARVPVFASHGSDKRHRSVLVEAYSLTYDDVLGREQISDTQSVNLRLLTVAATIGDKVYGDMRATSEHLEQATGILAQGQRRRLGSAINLEEGINGQCVAHSTAQAIVWIGSGKHISLEANGIIAKSLGTVTSHIGDASACIVALVVQSVVEVKCQCYVAAKIHIIYFL